MMLKEFKDILEEKYNMILDNDLKDMDDSEDVIVYYSDNYPDLYIRIYQKRNIFDIYTEFVYEDSYEEDYIDKIQENQMTFNECFKSEFKKNPDIDIRECGCTFVEDRVGIFDENFNIGALEKFFDVYDVYSHKIK